MVQGWWFNPRRNDRSSFLMSCANFLVPFRDKLPQLLFVGNKDREVKEFKRCLNNDIVFSIGIILGLKKLGKGFQ